jgi:hypothetical protein
MTTTCKAIRRDGQACTAKAQTDRDFCFFHDSDKADRVKAAQSKGGSKVATIAVEDLKQWRDVTVLKSPTSADIVNLIADTIDEVKSGKIDTKVATAVGYLSGVMLKALEYEALEERLQAIEEVVLKKGNQ